MRNTHVTCMSPRPLLNVLRQEKTELRDLDHLRRCWSRLKIETYISRQDKPRTYPVREAKEVALHLYAEEYINFRCLMDPTTSK